MEARIDKTVFQVTEGVSDDAAVDEWRYKTPNERLEQVELLRRINYGIDASSARLSRVFEVAEFPPS